MNTNPCPISVTSLIDPCWKDQNNHVNYAAYAQAADPAIDAVYAAAGLDQKYRDLHKRADYIVKSSFYYLKEIRGSDYIEVRSRLIDFDDKRAHIFCEIIDQSNGAVAAIAHILGIHVNTETGRSAPFADEVLERLERLKREHDRLEKPDFFDGSIGFAKPNLAD